MAGACCSAASVKSRSSSAMGSISSASSSSSSSSTIGSATAVETANEPVVDPVATIGLAVTLEAAGCCEIKDGVAVGPVFGIEAFSGCFATGGGGAEWLSSSYSSSKSCWSDSNIVTPPTEIPAAAVHLGTARTSRNFNSPTVVIWRAKYQRNLNVP